MNETYLVLLSTRCWRDEHDDFHVEAHARYGRTNFRSHAVAKDWGASMDGAMKSLHTQFFEYFDGSELEAKHIWDRDMEGIPEL